MPTPNSQTTKTTNRSDVFAEFDSGIKSAPKPAKADEAPVIELTGAEFEAAERIANAIESKKAAEAEHIQARIELESIIEARRIALSRQSGRYVVSVKVELAPGRFLKYTKKQQGSGPSGKAQAEQAETIRQQLGATEAERFLLNKTQYRLRPGVFDDPALVREIMARLGDLKGQVFEKVENYELAADFWTQQTLDPAFCDRARQLEQAGVIKSRAGEFKVG